MSFQSNGSQDMDTLLHTVYTSSTEQQDPKIQANKDTLVIEPFQIVDGDSDKVLLRMNHDGRFYLYRDFIGTMTSAAEIYSEEGELVAHLKDNKFMTSDNKVWFTIRDDGAIAVGSEPEMTWGPDGFLTNSDTGLKLVPADTKARIAASMLLSAFMGFGATDFSD
ncbi:MAG: hypothetical protein BGO31_12865 [Bacteroidetes bacterium 43-16]|nr:MAG: hypothetical protein BGO31_12865 [Bacteroidetes bacterium 43-16]